jgi:ribonuclease HI
MIRVYFDGACHNKEARSNPMGMGVVAYHEPHGTELVARYYHAGRLGTSNVAEWLALREALKTCIELAAKHPTEEFIIHGDSQLIVYQATGSYAVKQAEFLPYKEECDKLRAKLGERLTALTWVRREFNRRADQLSKQGLIKAQEDAEL